MATPGLLAPDIHCPDGRLRGAAGCIRGGLKAAALLAASQPGGATVWWSVRVIVLRVTG